MSGTAGFMRGLGFRPGRAWVLGAVTTEVGGGLLLAAGLLNPLGASRSAPLMMIVPLRPASAPVALWMLSPSPAPGGRVGGRGSQAPWPVPMFAPPSARLQ